MRALYRAPVLLALAALASAACGRERSLVPRDPSVRPAPAAFRLAVTPEVRRVAAGPTVDLEGRPSPDGRYLTKTDWDTGDLALYDVMEDRTIHLTRKGTWRESDDFAEASVISPNGRWIAFGWFHEEKDRYELRAMALTGADSGAVFTIYDAPDVGYPPPQAWTPDSRYALVALSRSDRTNELLLVPAPDCQDCRPRTLRSFDWRGPYDIAVSPDGRWVAYDFPSSETEAVRDVHVISIDGERASVVAAHPADDLVMGWSVDGSHLVFASERSGTMGVYAVAMQDGRTSGEAVLVRPDVFGLFPLGGTRDGRLAYGVQTGPRGVQIGSFDERGSIPTQLAPLPGSEGKAGTVLAWSPDGAYIAYGVSRNTSNMRATQVVIRSLERGDERRLTPKVPFVTALYWFPDGKSLLLGGQDDKGRSAYFRFDLASGAMKTIYAHEGQLFPRSVNLSRDGERLYFLVTRPQPFSTELQEVDVATGTVRTLSTAPGELNFLSAVLSPDGRQIAVVLRYRRGGSGLALVPAEGGAHTEFYRLPEGFTAMGGMAWTPNGRELVFGQSEETGDMGTELLRIPVTGGQPRSLGVRERGIRSMRLSPDGARIALSVIDYSAEIWLMDPPQLQAPLGVSAITP